MIGQRKRSCPPAEVRDLEWETEADQVDTLIAVLDALLGVPFWILLDLDIVQVFELADVLGSSS